MRHEMLGEAIEITGALFDGDNVNHRGKHLDVESARLYDRHDTRVPIGVAVSGEQSCTLAGRHADLMIAVEPKPELGEMFDEAGGVGKPRVGQMALCYDTGRDAAVQRAHEQFRWFGRGAAVRAGRRGARREDQAVLQAGFTEVALVQIGAARQASFIRWAQDELLPALPEL